MAWDPQTYGKFTAEREAPFADLLALLTERYPRDARMKQIVDLGCGTGALTAKLAEHFRDSNVIGIDSSEEMLAQTPPPHPGLSFRRGTIEETAPAWDVIFSHAALHWVEDHRALLPHLLSCLQKRGVLAIQMPANQHHPSQSILREVVAEEPFASALGGFVRASPVLSIAEYAEILWRAGAVDIAAVERVYPHVLADAEAVATWLRGTTMTPYFERLTAPLRAQLEARYLERLRKRFPERPVFFGFNRVLLSARRV